MIFLIIMGILILIVLISFTVAYNKMIKYKNKVKESLSLIDIHLKLRFDLIPNLVNVVKEYSKHEKEIFKQIIETRKLAIDAKEEKEKLEYANKLVPELRQILIIAEDYPQLKADSLYKSLMEELVLAEDKIAASRRFYDSNVSLYNTLIATFPNNIVASTFGFKEMELYKIDIGENFNTKINLEN